MVMLLRRGEWDVVHLVTLLKQINISSQLTGQVIDTSRDFTDAIHADMTKSPVIYCQNQRTIFFNAYNNSHLAHYTILNILFIDTKHTM